MRPVLFCVVLVCSCLIANAQSFYFEDLGNFGDVPSVISPSTVATDGRWLAYRSGGQVVIYDVSVQPPTKIVYAIPNFGQYIQAVAISNNRVFVTVGPGYTHIYDLTEQREVGGIGPGLLLMTGWQNEVYGIQESNGRYYLVGFDISDPQEPRLIGKVRVPGSNNQYSGLSYDKNWFDSRDPDKAYLNLLYGKSLYRIRVLPRMYSIFAQYELNIGQITASYQNNGFVMTGSSETGPGGIGVLLFDSYDRIFPEEGFTHCIKSGPFTGLAVDGQVVKAYELRGTYQLAGKYYFSSGPINAIAAAGDSVFVFRNSVRRLRFYSPSADTGVDDALVVRQTIPASMQLGQTAGGQITIRNTGTTTWRQNDYSLALIQDDALLSDQFYLRSNLELGTTIVPPGGEYTFNVRLFAAPGPSERLIRFRMVHEYVRYFGPVIDVVVNVGTGGAAADSAGLRSAASAWGLYQ